MKNALLKDLLDKIDLDQSPKKSHYLAFSIKPKETIDANPCTTINYEVFNTQLNPEHVKSSLKTIKSVIENTILKKERTFTTFDPKNPKDAYDFIILESLDFNLPEIQTGTLDNLDKDKYKVSYLINALKNSTPATSKKDYKTLKYTALNYIDNNNRQIILLNRVNPIYKSNSHIHFSVDIDDSPSTTPSSPIFARVQENLLRIPMVPAALIIDKYCIFIQNYAIEMFGFESHNEQICNSTLDTFRKDKFIDPTTFETMKTICKKQSVRNLFASLNNDKVQKIKDKDESTIKFLKEKLQVNFEINNDGLIVEDETSAERLLEYLCGKIFRGLDTEEFYSVSKAHLIIPNKTIKKE